MSGDPLVVQRLGHHQDAALWVQVEELGAVRVQAAVDRVHQLAVGVGVLRADLQDVLPRRGVLRDPHLNTGKNTEKDKLVKRRGREKGIVVSALIIQEDGNCSLTAIISETGPKGIYNVTENTRMAFVLSFKKFSGKTSRHSHNVHI